MGLVIVVIQRCRSASVAALGRTVAEIGAGMLVLVGVERGDDAAVAEDVARKVASLRIFSDAEGKMNLGLSDVAGSVLAVSQFTLAGDVRKGRRPSFDRALAGPEAERLFDAFVSRLRAEAPTKTGIFGADMQVDLCNDGPVTFIYQKRAGEEPAAERRGHRQ
ncbi:MAG: D-aminoacyl-tRNA deacylase [Acidobacteriota bacterium]